MEKSVHKRKGEFFAQNENRVNVYLGNILTLGLFVSPFLILMRLLNIFPGVAFRLLVAHAVIIFVNWCAVHFANRYHPYSHATKYFCIITLEISTVVLSISPYMAVAITYMTAPIISCMYYNSRFTLKMCILCWFGMVFSYVVRSIENVPSSPVHIHGWLQAFLVGNTIEYVICSVCLVIISKVITETLNEQYKQNEQILQMQNRLIASIASLVESKDETTAKHIERTSTYVNMLAASLVKLGYYTDELTEENIELFVKTAPLHDIGKMQVPEAILIKPGALTEEERSVVQLHTLYGAKIIDEYFSSIETEEFNEAALYMALCHHEWWNGHGYPLHLIEDEIPLAARIMAVADVLDALLSERPYKKAFTVEESFEIICKGSGTQFDPKIVEALVELKPLLTKPIE